ncbi:diguanylate cyclase (GGDEF)-like protein [Actinoplanes lutulentus]|uniref:Diguanylate cyclase (GGDEF)-like protein n=1 Tax=Actinoplanes lutulentus TaxID=1287878 RepID=A0A327YUV6_9ACTN|nr:GGDEF domain-containing protein [Actinoplanes lutulentus]MBB2940534.1 diguanylate cyclase (GGDEF)-like protein [Actinoplanes lutulentus]RAK24804.1 diguanylate cyclase (GGDEF)-like protein [Actinoplanes lutulentus]
MFITHLVIATILAATTGAGMAYVAARSTVNRLRAELDEAHWQLSHDPLTGLSNRAGLRDAHRAVATGRPHPVTIMLIDLDSFKTINDIRGHDAGDAVLEEIATRIESLAELYDGCSARLSGDEFAVILDHDYKVAKAAELFVSILGFAMDIRTGEGTLTVAVAASIGVAVVSSTDPLDTVALHRADTAMYHAKKQGGNRHVLYTPGMTMPDGPPRRGPRPRDLHDRNTGPAA